MTHITAAADTHSDLESRGIYVHILQHTAATHYRNALLQHTTATHCCNTLKVSLPQLLIPIVISNPEESAFIYCNTPLQHTAATHCCNTVLQHTTATHYCNTLLQHTLSLITAAADTQSALES